MPSKETEANNDVDGKRKGFIPPFTAIAALRIANAVFRILKNTTISGLLGLSATYAYAPPIKNV